MTKLYVSAQLQTHHMTDSTVSDTERSVPSLCGALLKVLSADVAPQRNSKLPHALLHPKAVVKDSVEGSSLCQHMLVLDYRLVNCIKQSELAPGTCLC